MDLELNNLLRLICHKTQPTNQPTCNFLIMEGDMYALIDNAKNYKFPLHNSSNRKREYLAEFSVKKNLL